MVPGDGSPGFVRLLRRLPCKLLLATMLLCLGSREWYPFSPFPMYSNFAPQTWYVFVTDDSDRVLPTEAYFGVDARPLRRMFETRALWYRAGGASAGEADARAAVALLQFLRAEARPEGEGLAMPGNLRLWRTRTRVDQGGIARREQMLAEIGPP